MFLNRSSARIVVGVVMVLTASCPARAFDPDAPGQGMIPVPPPPAPAATPAASPPSSPAPAVPGAAPVLTLPNGALPTAPEPVPNPKPVSLFITPEELARINGALAAYKRMRENQSSNAENQAKNFLNQLEDKPAEVSLEPAKPVPFTYPQFYLQAISFQNDNDWMVILNGQKFIPNYDDPNSPLKMVIVDKDSVVVEWRPQDMEKVMQSWVQVPIGQSDVLVDSGRGTVTFTLRQNQTFSSYAMRVVEGKVQPVTVMIMPDAIKNNAPGMPLKPAAKPPGPAKPAAAAPEAAPPPPPPAASTGDGEKKEGLAGLNATYKKMGLEP